MEKFIFKIIKKSPFKLNGIWYQVGKIIIGNFKERFGIPLDYWSLDQYKKQWKDGIERLKTHDSSLLVTKIGIDRDELYVCAWVLYKVGDMIYFQYHFYPDDDKSNLSFDAQTCYMHILPRSNKLEEWSMKAKDFFASWHQKGSTI